MLERVSEVVFSSNLFIFLCPFLSLSLNKSGSFSQQISVKLINSQVCDKSYNEQRKEITSKYSVFSIK